MTDVYLFGMSLVSTIHRLATPKVPPAGYAEVLETHVCPGGEAMNAALLLSGLGLRTALSGPRWGLATRDVLERYTARFGIARPGLGVDSGFAGVRDVVLVAGEERVVLGWFGQYFADPARRWDEPATDAMAAARIVAIDPYFPGSSERAARLAQQLGKPYVTIDCPYDGELHRGAAASVISREFRSQRYPSADSVDLFRRYAQESTGLTIFTAGPEPILFGRAATAARTLPTFSVPVKSTLGAGDAFRAGVVFGLLNQLEDEACVRFAAALAALACTRLPIADNLPALSDVEALLRAPVATGGTRIESFRDA